MSDIYIDVDTAIAVPVNVLGLIDDTDFKTLEESIVYNAAGMDLNWNFVTSAGVQTQTNVVPTTAGVHDWTNVGNGFYKLEIPASAGTINNDTEGYGWFSGVITGVLPFRGPVMTFRAAALNNSLIDGGDNLEVSLISTGLDAISSTATGMVEIAKAIWDRVLTGATHNINNSAGKRLRVIDAAFEVHSGTAQAGSTASTFVMDTGADGTNNDIYRGDRIVITGGTGVGEHGIVISYVASTRVATMSENWVVTPDNTSEFTVVPADTDIETWNHSVVTGDGDWAEMQTDLDAVLVDTAEIGTAGAGLTDITINAASVDAVWDEALSGHQTAGSTGRNLTFAGAILAETTVTGTPTSTTLNLTSGSTTDDFYNDMELYFIDGNNAGLSRIITDYTGSTKLVTFDEALPLTITSGDAVVVKTVHKHSKSQIADAVWDEALSGHTTAGSSGKSLSDTETDAAAILVDTAEIGAAGAGLTDLGGMSTAMKAEVNAEVVDVIDTDTSAELAAVPAATSSLRDRVAWLFALARNKLTQTATTASLLADDGTTEIAASTDSDDATTATRGEWS